MFLAVNIGNTNIVCALFRNGKIIKKFTIHTEYYRQKKIKEKLMNYKESITASIICSVVPYLTKILERDLKKILPNQPFILGKNILPPIKNLYRKPKQLGFDRLVNAYAATALFKTPLIVMDFGTAVTLDIVSKQNEFLGGMILPGMQASLNALSQYTAALPKLKLAAPKEFIGRDTKNGILSGIVYGYTMMAEEISEKIKKIIGKNTLLIVTGGDAELIKKYSQKIDKIEKNLTLKGLYLIYCNCVLAKCKK